MACLVRSVVRFGAEAFLRPNNLRFAGCRQFINPQVIGLDHFLETRSSCLERVGNKKDQFRNQMEEHMHPSVNQIIFTEDLKAMIHVAETSDDISTVLKMITRYHSERKNLVNYRQSFGSAVMKMFYYLQLPKQALDAFFNKELEGFFYQPITVTILCDLLFDHGQYDPISRVIDVWWPIYAQRRSTSKSLPRDFTALCLATYCKQNSAASFLKAKAHLDVAPKSKEVGFKPFIYFALLALKQNHAEEALETITRVIRESSKTTSSINIQLLAYLKLGRRKEALQILADVVEDTPISRPMYLCADVVAEVEKSLASCTDKELARQLEVALGSVKTSNYARDFTLEHYLFQPFSSRQSSSSGVHSRGNRYSQMSTVGKYVDLRNRSHSLLNKEETVPL